MVTIITTLFKTFLKDKEKIFLTVMALIVASLIGVIVYKNAKIDSLTQDNEFLTYNNTALTQELKKRVSDHEYQIIPEKINLKEELDRAEKEWFKKHGIKTKDVSSYSKISTRVDTVFLPSKITAEKDGVDVATTHHTLDFSGKSHINIVTFKSKQDSVYDAKSRLSMSDSIRYVAHDDRVKVGTKRFLFFKFPKYKTFTKITVTNTNDLVKMQDVIIKIDKD